MGKYFTRFSGQFSGLFCHYQQNQKFLFECGDWSEFDELESYINWSDAQ